MASESHLYRHVNMQIWKAPVDEEALLLHVGQELAKGPPE